MQFWSFETLTDDVSTKHNFLIKVALIWTINDFPAFRMVSSWSMHEKLTCTYCMENNKAFMLTNDYKTSFFYYHRRFLPMDHKYRKNINDFFVGRVERDVASPLSLSEKLYDMVSKYDYIMFGFQSSKQKFFYFDLTNNWVKQKYFLRASLLKNQSHLP
jgi:hypothetical protein